MERDSHEFALPGEGNGVGGYDDYRDVIPGVIEADDPEARYAAAQMHLALAQELAAGSEQLRHDLFSALGIPRQE